MVVESLSQSLMLEAPLAPNPDKLLISGKFDLQRKITSMSGPIPRGLGVPSRIPERLELKL